MQIRTDVREFGDLGENITPVRTLIANLAFVDGFDDGCWLMQAFHFQDLIL